MPFSVKPEASITDDDVVVIAPNFKKRLSGVTSTIIRLVPHQMKVLGITTLGPGLPDDLPRLSYWQALTLKCKRRGDNPWRVWHARRNVEMLGGLIYRYVFGKKIKLLFTSAAQRHHTGYTKWLINQMDHVIATSHKSASYLERQATVIHHGIDVESYAPASDKANLRKELGLDCREDLLIGCFGRIRLQKGTDLFVDSLIELCKSHTTLKAIILGRTTEKYVHFEADLKNRIKQAGLEERILFLGEVPTPLMGKYFASLDLYVAPQRWEGFGLTPLEAMAAGVPVVATRVGAFEELVEPEKTGQLIEPDNLEAMISAIDAMISDRDKLKVLAQNARHAAEEKFRIEVEAQKINAVYEMLLNKADA